MARKRKKSKSVQITNPLPGGSTYTSERSAQELVIRGRAVWESHKPPKSIYLLPEKLAEQLAQVQGDVEVDSAIEANRGGVVFWNGADHSKARHRPGEVRS